MVTRLPVSINSTSYKRSDVASFKTGTGAEFPLIPLPIKEAIVEEESEYKRALRRSCFH